MISRRSGLVVMLLLAAGCKKPPPAVVYQALPVEQRDIIVSAQASGVVQPDTVVEVKSKASGELLELRVETGQLVPRGALMALIDLRNPRNALAQAQAELDVARARLENAASQKQRADELLRSQSITQQEFEKSVLDYATAKADVVRARIAIDNAKDQLDDTRVTAPISGTVIDKKVERGQVISSPTRDVGGGTVLFSMADLTLVQVRTLVDETDIGKLRPGLRATVTVDAFPNRPFEGAVLKIEPKAETQQNVTMFPVLVRIDNREGLLRPGMNSEVEIHVGRRDGVLAVSNAALRTSKDVGSAAMVLGLDPKEVQRQLAAAAAPPADGDSTRRETLGGGSAAPTGTPASSGANTMTTPDGRVMQLPPGVTAERARAIFAKFRTGEAPTADERALLARIRQANPRRAGEGSGRRPSGDLGAGGQFVVFVKSGATIEPKTIRTGLTDLDYSEVLSGLKAGDSVLVLPSASLIQSQQEFKERVNRMTGGGGMPGVQQQPSGGRPQTQSR